MSERHHIPAGDEWLFEHMQEVTRLLHRLVRQGEDRHAQMERLIALLEEPATFPQATGAEVTSP